MHVRLLGRPPYTVRSDVEGATAGLPDEPVGIPGEDTRA
jgi:hypothetical protein